MVFKFLLRAAFLVVALLFPTMCFAQTWGTNPQLNELEHYYVKSLNEFMHRFNADEVPSFITGDGNVRSKCILALFDLEQIPSGDTEEAKRILRFDSVVRASSTLLHITDSGFFAEARCAFSYKRKDIELGLILSYELIRDDLYRWVVVGVNGLEAAGLLDTAAYGYLNPVQHELRFPGLSDAFAKLNGYFSRQHAVDRVSFFAGLAASGTLRFIGCQSVSYYFTQVPGYVFTVSLHPRLGINAGWLIHDLYEMKDEDKAIFINYLRQ